MIALRMTWAPHAWRCFEEAALSVSASRLFHG
jgi:hypothetical protein